MNYQKTFESELSLINSYLNSVLTAGENSQSEKNVIESMNYTLLSGGKRFRPLLSLLTARALNTELSQVLPFAAAVEMIHAYSLVHDDLPMMDDDDERRGEPTNHKVYGDAIALLAGDALQTYAFELIAESYKDKNTAAGLRAVALLAKASGAFGMVGGQAIDMQAIDEARGTNTSKVKSEDIFNEQLVSRMHALKTGALITVAVEGAAVLCEAGEKQHQALKTFAQELGLSFQLADDLLDYDESNPEPSGFPTLVGLDRTHELLKQHSQAALGQLVNLEGDTQGLKSLIDFNLSRTV